MRWGIRKQHAAQSAPCVQEGESERGVSKGKGKARVLSFSPLSWLGKLTGKENLGAAAKHAPASTPKNGAAAAPAFPSCLPKRTSPSPVMVTQGRRCSPPRRSPAPADVAPRPLSVGNDNADAEAARWHCQRSRRRHCSLGGDHELLPLGHLIPFSLAGSPTPARPARTAAAAPSDTEAGPARANRRRRRRRRRSSRRISNISSSGRRSSFSGRMMPLRVARVVRSPRRAAAVAPELERLAVVRRTRDPQRAFRESMVEMIASGGGDAPPRPEELERLLACYLSLNADEHHDCIVKVFRQVWFEYVNLLPRLDAARRRPPPQR